LATASRAARNPDGVPSGWTIAPSTRATGRWGTSLSAYTLPDALPRIHNWLAATTPNETIAAKARLRRIQYHLIPVKRRIPVMMRRGRMNVAVNRRSCSGRASPP
jgi:hypothetical protein